MGVVPQRLPPLPGDAGRVLPGRRVDRDHLLDGRLEGGNPRGSRVVAPMDRPPVRAFSLACSPSAFSLARARTSLSVTTGHEGGRTSPVRRIGGLPSPYLESADPRTWRRARRRGAAHSVDAEVQPETSRRSPPVAVASRRQRAPAPSPSATKSSDGGRHVVSGRLRMYAGERRSERVSDVAGFWL